MKIFNIYTVANQAQYHKEDYSMILAHIVEKGLYDPINMRNSMYIIMDNGVYEHAQVSKSMLDLISLARKQRYIIDEIVIPDVLGDYEATKQLYNDNYQTMFGYRDDYTYMYVSQASSIEQLRDAVNMVNDEKYLKLVLGIPKNMLLDRTSKEAIKVLKTCKVPIHFLGIKNNYRELLPVKHIIRSCDSVQLSYIARDYSVQDSDLIGKTRQGRPIDLLTDIINETKLDMTRIVVNKELKKNELL